MATRLRVLLAGLLLLLRPPAHADAQAVPLRVCLDPDNLPFSSSHAEPPGIYVELAQRIAAALGSRFEPVWTRTYFGKHQVRTTLLAGRCDAFIGLPETADFMGPRVVMSQPILSLGYALVSPRGAPAASLADLAGKRVAVQFDTPPQSLLASRDDVRMVTVLSPEEAMRDLAAKAVDDAFIWGPSAGWVNRSSLNGAYRVVPVAGKALQWQAAIGFPSGGTGLRDAVDRVLPGLKNAMPALLAKYGFPDAAPIELAAAPAQPAQPTAAAGSAEQISAGRGLFNQNCSHCHGPDAVQGVRRRNLRLLHERHGDEMDQVFFTTVTHGRPDKGMPNWSGILSNDQFHAILAFLHSIQQR